jgi:hypothetical protein
LSPKRKRLVKENTHEKGKFPRADEVTDWNRNMFEAARLNVPPTGPLPMTRNAALVQAAVFDAVNGIERRFTPVHVDPAAPDGASRRQY